MSIDKILEDMENMLLDATRVPLTNKRVIEEDEIALFIDEIREVMPKELSEAKNLLSQRQRILEDAQREAQNIVDQAKKYVIKLTDEHLITKQAEEQAHQIISEARKTAQELKTDSMNYAADVFNHLVTNVELTLQTVRNAQGELKQSQKNLPE